MLILLPLMKCTYAIYRLIASRFNGDIDFLTLEISDTSVSLMSALVIHAHQWPINFLQCEQQFVISASEDRTLKVTSSLCRIVVEVNSR